MAASGRGQRFEMTGEFRSYEVYQRMRLRDTTELMKPKQLSSEAYLLDPYPLVAILRENYPCYRDWPGNAFWVTRYDDVTSVFVDEANFGSRTKLWSYARVGFGSDLGREISVEWAWANLVDSACVDLTEEMIGTLIKQGSTDLAIDFCARFPLELLLRVFDVPGADADEFLRNYLIMQRGVGFEPVARDAGVQAMDALTRYFDSIVRRGVAGQDTVSAMIGLGATGSDIVTTLLEFDHQTLHGAMANLWFLMLTQPAQFALVRDNPRLMKSAYLEALRHSPPVISADRFARHEVERFGRLLPDGALVRCCAAAANRDPRVFDDPERFHIERLDLTQREPRGMYRADGLPSGISFATGPPSRHPAVPEDRPRSCYAITRDLAVIASSLLLEAFPGIRLAEGAAPVLRSLRIGEMHTCWSLPVVW